MFYKILFFSLYDFPKVLFLSHKRRVPNKRKIEIRLLIQSLALRQFFVVWNF